MDEGKHKIMKPKELCASRPEYKAYNPKTFSSHIEQETRARKFITWLKDKRDKKNKSNAHFVSYDSLFAAAKATISTSTAESAAEPDPPPPPPLPPGMSSKRRSQCT